MKRPKHMGGWWKEVEWAVRSWIFDTDTKQTKIVKAVVFQEQSQCLILALYRKVAAATL
jgi:hypothetical protein